MKMLKLISTLISVSIVVFLASCSITKPHEKNLAIAAQPLGLKEVSSQQLDAVYIADNAVFSSYKQVILEPLDMSAVKIRKPSNTRMLFDTPWELNNQDRRYYQDRYSQSMQKEWFEISGLTQVAQAAMQTLKVKATLVEIAPLGSKDDSKGRPGMTKVYSEGVGTMILKVEVSDALSGKVLALISDERDLGKLWEENNRVSFNQKVRIAFNAWANRLRKQLI